VSQHASLDPERWARFDVDQQILMIANEMNRTTRRLVDRDPDPRRRGYERVLRLTDLTAAPARPALRRELLRWRDLVAALYVADESDPDGHRAAFRALLQLRPATARQIPLLLG
jgi:hypothetical protein